MGDDGRTHLVRTRTRAHNARALRTAAASLPRRFAATWNDTRSPPPSGCPVAHLNGTAAWGAEEVADIGFSRYSARICHRAAALTSCRGGGEKCVQVEKMYGNVWRFRGKCVPLPKKS